jgi:hypothetical protein
VTGVDLNAIVGAWDDIVASTRREFPIFGSLLEHAMPSGISASGVLTLQMEQEGMQGGVAARLNELTTALAPHLPGVTRVVVKVPEGVGKATPARMTAESVKSDTLQSLRKRSPLLAAAIDELDLDLV